MTKLPRLLPLAVPLAAGVAFSAAAADKISIHTSADPMLRLNPVTFDGGRTLELTVGIGSGAFRHPSAPGDIFQTVSDRGPNFTCKDGVEITALDQQRLCGGAAHARIYPVPEYAPSIYTVKLLNNGSFRVIEAIALKDKDGVPLTGLLNPLTKAKTEIPFDRHGRRLAQDAGAVDVESLVKLGDGSYWLCDEQGPSIFHAGADGRMIKRLVPAGTETDYATANYTVEGKLPAILYKRHTNRGIESIAISPDERFLYFAMQSPLDNPGAKAYKKGRNIRVFKFDRPKEKVVGEYVYVIDKPQTFRLDRSKKQNAVKISEMRALGLDKLLILERISKTTKLYEVDLAGATNILDSKWDDPANRPTLEQTSLDKAAITPVTKKLFFTTDDHKGLPAKLEGMARLGDGSWALTNDDDFGIDGARTTVVVLRRDKQQAKSNK